MIHPPTVIHNESHTDQAAKRMDNFEKAKQHFLSGLQLLEANHFSAAESQFARSLELLPDRASTLNNLSALKIKLGKFAEAEEFARKAAALENKSPEAWSNIGMALAATERHEEALQAFDRALACGSNYAKAWLAKAKTLLELKKYEEALLACDEAVKLDSSNYEMLHTKSLLLKELNRPEEAQKIYRQSLEMRVVVSPVFITERRATQKAEILILSSSPDLDDSLKSFEMLHRGCKNFPGQLAVRLLDDFHFAYVFIGDAARQSARPKIPQPEILINNHVNGEIIVSGGNLAALNALVDSFGVPVINHPAKAVQTTRDESAKLVAGIPGVVVPKTMRFSAEGKTREEMVQEIEAEYEYPMITRTLASQMGKGMTKVDNREALVEVLAAGLKEKFFVTEFVDGRSENKFFRRIRAAVIHNEIVLARADYAVSWNVQGRRSPERVAFFSEHAFLLKDEERICKDPEAALGRSAMQSLRAIRDLYSLDVFGIDFDVDADGRVIFYEANATMNLFSTSRAEIPYSKDVEDYLRQAFKRCFTSLLVGR